MNRKFNVDFFEFAFLVEACLPEAPIARTMFFRSVSEDYYHIMTNNEREQLFNWIQKSYKFDLEKEECQHFYDRFNPDNQYKVYNNMDGEVDYHECYLHKGQYHLKHNTWIAKEYIAEVEKVVEK